MLIRSPRLNRLTSLPTCSTSPISSWPVCDLPFSMIGSSAPRYRCRSDPQMEVAATRTSIS